MHPRKRHFSIWYMERGHGVPCFHLVSYYTLPGLVFFSPGRSDSFPSLVADVCVEHHAHTHTHNYLETEFFSQLEFC